MGGSRVLRLGQGFRGRGDGVGRSGGGALVTCSRVRSRCEHHPLGSRLHAECTDVAVVCSKTGKSGEYTINCEWTLV